MHAIILYVVILLFLIRVLVYIYHPTYTCGWEHRSASKKLCMYCRRLYIISNQMKLLFSIWGILSGMHAGAASTPMKETYSGNPLFGIPWNYKRSRKSVLIQGLMIYMAKHAWGERLYFGCSTWYVSILEDVGNCGVWISRVPPHGYHYAPILFCLHGYKCMENITTGHGHACNNITIQRVCISK